MCKGSILVVLGIEFLHLLEWSIALGIGCNIDASCKASALGDEEHSSVITWTQLLHRLVYLQEVLVVEGLVDGDIVVAPTEVCGCTRFLSGTGRTSNAVDMDVATDDAGLQCRKQSQLYASGKATGIGQVHGTNGLLSMCLWQAIHIVMFACYTEILCQVDDAHMGRNLVLLKEGTALAMTKAEEHHIHLFPRHLAGEAEVGFAIQALVYLAHRIAGIGFAIGKDYLCLGMVQQHTDEFTTSVTCRTKYTNFNHILICLCPQPNFVPLRQGGRAKRRGVDNL